MKKLVDLDPRWFGIEGVRFGLTFNCPHCTSTRLAVPFTPAIHKEECKALLARGWEYPLIGVRWLRVGESFSNITLRAPKGASGNEHWHGHITDGLI